MRLPPRPPPLAGREALLTQVDAGLSAGDGLAPRIVALYGLGGAGKTSVAVECAYRHLAEVGVAWQFAAEDSTVLAAGFGELAAQLGVRGLADTRDPVASVHAVLARFAAPWLLVFDNAADLASVAAFLPPAGPGHVLITSQNPAWPGQPLEVPMLDQDIAAGFLVDRTRDPDRQAAEDLADILDGLPLALEQAAAYIQAIGGTLAGYLALFRQRRTELLARGEPTGYRGTVASTWALAFDRLRHTAPGAVGLLRLLAFCAPEAIPLRLLLKPRPGLAGQLGDDVAPVLVPLLEDPLAAGDAIAALRRYSLVTPAGEGSVSVHRLVQAVTADQMPAELAGAWRQAAAVLIEAAIPRDPQQPANWPAFGVVLSHAEVALPADSVGMVRIAEYLGASGNYAAARDLWCAISELRERVYGPEHLDTLTARTNLARLTGQAGDPVGARDQLAALLPLRERLSGLEDTDTLTTCAILANFTGQAGNAAWARDQYAALIPVIERAHGPEHPETLTVRANLAYWTGEAGDPVGARDQFAELLPIRERVLGPEHPDTVTARTNLAYWTGEAGDPVGARDQYAALLPIRERLLGLEHPETLTVRANLARWTGQAGDPAGAWDQYAALVPVALRVLGPEHPETLTDQLNFAAFTGEAGDAAGARRQYAALVSVIERVLGQEHPNTLATRANLARWTGEAGDAAGARDQFAALVPVDERVRGPEHPQTLTARANLAYWTGEAGDPVGGRDQYAELLPIRERVSGLEHPETLGIRTNLARLTGEAGDPAAARDQFAALVPMIERVRSLENRQSLAARNNLAAFTGEAGDPAGAKDQFAALVPVIEQVLGPEHRDTLAARNNLAYWTWRANGNPEPGVK